MLWRRLRVREGGRCRANMVHMRQSSPYSGLGLQVNSFLPVAFSLGSGSVRGHQERVTWEGVAEAWTKASATPFSAMANTSALYHANAPCTRSLLNLQWCEGSFRSVARLRQSYRASRRCKSLPQHAARASTIPRTAVHTRSLHAVAPCERRGEVRGEPRRTAKSGRNQVRA